MITRIRIEAIADDPGLAKAEIEAAYAHFAQATFLEGISSGEGTVTSEVYERAGDDGGNDVAGSFYSGRKVVQFSRGSGDGLPKSGGVKLYGYRVFDNPAESNPPPGGWSASQGFAVTSSSSITYVSASPEPKPKTMGEEVTEKVMVLVRRRPVTREHAWDD